LQGASQRFARTGAGAGVDSAWEQKKLEARKMLENRAESQRPVHAVLGNRHDKGATQPISQNHSQLTCKYFTTNKDFGNKLTLLKQRK